MIDLIDAREIADILGMNAAHVRDRVTRARDFPPAIRIGNSLRWDRAEIAAWIEARKFNRGVKRSRKRREYS